MSYTVAQKIQIAKLCQALADDDVANGSLFGKKLDPMLPIKIYVIRKDVEWLYDIDPTNSDLTAISNLMMELCQVYVARAWAIISGASGGRVVTPVTPSTSNIGFYLITRSEFANTTDVNAIAALDGKTIAVFANWANRYLNTNEYQLILGGTVRVLINGFDSTSFPIGDIILKIEIQ